MRGEELWDSWGPWVGFGFPAWRSLPSGFARLHSGISLLCRHPTGKQELQIPSWGALSESCSEQTLSGLHEVPVIVLCHLVGLQRGLVILMANPAPLDPSGTIPGTES